MFRDILSSRGIIFGFVFFVVIVGSTQLYSWHVRRRSQEELERTNRTVQMLENKKDTRTGEDAGVPVDIEALGELDTPIKTYDMHTMSEETETLLSLDDLADAFLPDDMVSTEEEPAEDVPVSPHGFGPYPEVPVGYPKLMTPTWIKNENPSRDHELMHRVLIKLWNQGDHDVSGAVMKGGLVYPLYPNTAYVTYDSIEMPDGTVRRFIRSATGPLGTKPIRHPGERFPVLPEGITAIDRDNAGINPYEFLDLR